MAFAAKKKKREEESNQWTQESQARVKKKLNKTYQRQIQFNLSMFVFNKKAMLCASRRNK